MPYPFESIEDRAIVVTLSGDVVVARDIPFDDVSGARLSVVMMLS